MQPDLIIAYSIMAGGATATLFSAYQMIKRGFLLWILLIGLGMSALYVGYHYSPDVPFQAMIPEFESSALTKLPTEQLQKLCIAAGL